MTIEQFIEAAIEGGYILGNDKVNTFEESDSHYSSCWYFHKGFDYLIPEILLDPESWKAVGKVKGWSIEMQMPMFMKEPQNDPNTFVASEMGGRFGYDFQRMPFWYFKMVGMIQALYEGKTLEEYIATL